tara:strand:+ start:3935 stop:4642 length:708 start_codon:yes stop_codon:yes gene_type:complete
MALNTVDSLNNWNPQNSCIERLTDNAAYTSAHPDDTLVLVGPARYSDVADDGSSLTPVGMLQGLQVSQQKPVTPLQTIGSGRTYFLSGKTSVSWGCSRLFAKGNNLSRALYSNLANANGNALPDFNIEEPAASEGRPNSVFNLDSELFLVPFGIAVAFRDKSGFSLGAFYLELCMIQSYSMQLASGQNVIMENVQGACDRVFPIDLGVNESGGFFSTEGTSVTLGGSPSSIVTGQ